MKRALSSLVVIAFVAVLVRAAGEDPADRIRSDLQSLVFSLAQPSMDEPGDASPTARVNRLLGTRRAQLVPVLEDLHRRALTEGTEAARVRDAVRETIRFLYGLEGKEPAFRVIFGAVIPHGVPRGDYDFGSFRPRPSAPAPPTFTELTAGGKLRRPFRPDGKKLLDRVRTGDFEGWEEGERHALAAALGESARRSAALRARVLSLSREDPVGDLPEVAAAFAGGPEAEALLAGRVRAFSARLAKGRGAVAPLLARAATHLAFVSRAAFLETVASLDASGREALLGALPVRLSMAVLLREVETAPDQEAREGTIRRLADLVGRDRMKGSPDPADIGAVLAVLAGALDDRETREAARRGAARLLFAFVGHRAGGSAHMNDIEEKTDVESLGPYPGLEPILRGLAADVGAGTVVCRGGGVGLFEDAAIVPGRRSGRLASDVTVEMPNRGESGEPMPVHLAAEITDAGLRLTFTNRADMEIALNTVGFRYGVAEIVRVTFSGKEIGTLRFETLALKLSSVNGRFAVRASALTRLAPGAGWSFTVPLRPEHRGIQHISVAADGAFRVLGRPEVPVLDRFHDTWVK